MKPSLQFPLAEPTLKGRGPFGGQTKREGFLQQKERKGRGPFGGENGKKEEIMREICKPP
jgi:hypothetical protein